MDLINKYKDFYTVGQLLEYIIKYNIPMDAKILMQRVEDRYFEGIDTSGMCGQLEDGSYGSLPLGSKAKGWETFRIEGENSAFMRNLNERIDSGEFNDKEEYPDIKPENLIKFTEEDIDKVKDEYYPCWSPVYYENEKHLFLDAHY